MTLSKKVQALLAGMSIGLSACQVQTTTVEEPARHFSQAREVIKPLQLHQAAMDTRILFLDDDVLYRTDGLASKIEMIAENVLKLEHKYYPKMVEKLVGE